jgi:hypothetical protein
VNSTSNTQRERGQVVVLFALLLPMILALGSVVIGLGNWYVHAKNLQTKADAGAFAGGNAWSFPCGGNADSTIISQALKYAGPSTSPPNTSPGENPQVGGVPSSKIHTVLNGTDWYDDDGNPAPTQWNSPSSNPTGGTGALCNSKILDVKLTEDNSFPLASLIPLFPDIKRKARVQIEEGSGFSGLLPIAVRVPKPLSAAAIYVDETSGSPNYGHILSARYFKDICEATTSPPYSDCVPTSDGTIPNGLDQWTTKDTSPLLPGIAPNQNAADISSMPLQTGVVVALSFRPACGTGANPCLNITSATDINTLCNQGGTVQCYYTTTSGGNDVFQSGLQYIRRYSAPTSDNAPELGSVWLDAIIGTNCTNGYFSAPVANSCFASLNADVDVSAALAAGGQVEVRYKMVSGGTSWQEDDAPGPCGNNFGTNCDLISGFAPVEFVPQYARHAFAIRVRLQNVTNPVSLGLPADCANGFSSNCQWFFTGAGPSQNVPTNQEIFDHPVQRAFMGNLDRSGPVKFLHLYNVSCADGSTVAGAGLTGQAASVQGGQRCFRLDMGLQGALARDQDEYPIQLNIGATSQSSVVDCDPNISNLKDEIAQGCQWPNYAKHDFATTPYCPAVSGANQFFSVPQPAPWQNWGANNGAGPFTCVLTQASATPNQVVQGLNDRFFGVTNNPSCPADNAEFVKGRNYWHDYNNEYVADPDGSGSEGPQADYWTFATARVGRPVLPHDNHLRNDDPRLVLLFITPYNSFTGNGNETYPISLIGGFYITGYGRILGNGTLINEDPCSNGAAGGGTSPTSPYAGNTPPPDIDTSTAGAVAWGHFIVPVDLGTSTGGTGVLCQTASTTACVAVLVE